MPNSTTGVCQMDGASGISCSGTCPARPQFRYVDNSTGILNPYLELATQYGWANYMFQTNQGPSFPAHQFIFGGTSAPSTADDAAGVFASENMSGSSNDAGCAAAAGTTVQLIDPNGDNEQDLSVLRALHHGRHIASRRYLAILHTRPRFHLDGAERHPAHLPVNRTGGQMRGSGLVQQRGP